MAVVVGGLCGTEIDFRFRDIFFYIILYHCSQAAARRRTFFFWSA